MKKITKILLSLSIAFTLSFMLISCHKTKEHKIVSIILTDDTNIDIDVDNMDLSALKIKIIYDNDEEEIINFDESYLITDISTLGLGSSTIEAIYNDFQFHFVLTFYKQIDLGFRYSLDPLGLNYYITDYVGTEETIILPEIYQGKQVTGVEASAFQNNATIKSVIIPGGYQYLGEAAFYNCPNLKMVYVPKTLKNIDQYALNSAHIIVLEGSKKDLKVVNENWYDSKNAVIYENTLLDMIEIEKDFIYILTESFGISVLAYLGNEEKIEIPSMVDYRFSVVSIGSNAFYKCNTLKEVTLSSDIRVIEKMAFCLCENLEKITLSTNLKRIEENAFGNCINLSEVIFQDQLEFIGHNAFIQCSSLKSLTLPSSLTKIDTYAFAWCMGLEDIYIPSSVVDMGAGVVYGCSSLTVNCEATSKPSTWHNDWNPNNRTVNWGVTK